MFMSTSTTSSGDEDPKKARQMMAAMMGPGHVDSMMRHAVQACWNVLPEEKRTIAELRQQLQRMLDRAVKDQQDDAAAFAMPIPPG